MEFSSFLKILASKTGSIPKKSDGVVHGKQSPRYPPFLERIPMLIEYQQVGSGNWVKEKSERHSADLHAALAKDSTKAQ